MEANQKPYWSRGASWETDKNGISKLKTNTKAALDDISTVINTGLNQSKQARAKAQAWRVSAENLTKNTTSAIDNAVSNFANNLLETGAKFMLLSPTTGDIYSARRAVISMLNSTKENYPNFNKDSYVGAVISISYTSDLLATMIEWALTTTLIFGANTPAIQDMLRALKTPLFSPIAQVAERNEELVKQSIRKAITPNPEDSNPFSNLIPSDVISGFADFIQNSTISKVAQGKSILSEFLNIPAPENQALSEEILRLRNLESLDSVNTPPIFGNKITFTDEGVKIDVSDEIDRFLKKPYDTWYDLVKLQDVHGALSDVMKVTRDVVKDIKGVTEDLVDGIQSTMVFIDGISEKTENAIAGLFNQANSMIDQVNLDIGLHTFDTLVIPPQSGGLEKLRFLIAENTRPGVLNVPDIPYPSSMMIFMLVYGSPDLVETFNTAANINNVIKFKD